MLHYLALQHYKIYMFCWWRLTSQLKDEVKYSLRNRLSNSGLKRQAKKTDKLVIDYVLASDLSWTFGTILLYCYCPFSSLTNKIPNKQWCQHTFFYIKFGATILSFTNAATGTSVSQKCCQITFLEPSLKDIWIWWVFMKFVLDICEHIWSLQHVQAFLVCLGKRADKYQISCHDKWRQVQNQ
jgi:hypothetical protein